MSRTRVRLAVVGALVSALLAGCASVPSDSPVQVLRQIAGGEALPPAPPVAGSAATDLVRDFVTASASSADKHSVARQYLTPEAAATWDDGASTTVLEGFSTVPTPGTQVTSDAGSIQIRSTRKIGRLDTFGAFEPDESESTTDVELQRRSGEWRISRLPNGVVVDQSDLIANYRAVNVWFVDPARRRVVPDLRYVAGEPLKTQPTRLMELLIAGPDSSPVLAGAAISQIQSGARLRSNVVIGPDNVVVVDLTGLGLLDDPARQLLAAQVVLTLTEISNVTRVSLLVDGEPLIPGHPPWTRQDVLPLMAAVSATSDAPALVTTGGRVGTLSGSAPLTPLPGSAGDGRINAESAVVSADGAGLAVVARGGAGVNPAGASLLVGTAIDGSLAQSVVEGVASLTRPTWTPTGDEVWTVAAGTRIVRVRVDDAGKTTVADVDAGDLGSVGPITELRLSRDGMRVLAVAGGGLYVGAIVRGLSGPVAIRDVRRLRPTTLAAVTAADWMATDSILVATTEPVFMVAKVQSNGLTLTPFQLNNLSQPVTAVAASRNAPLLVADQSGVWSVASEKQAEWRGPVSGGAPGAVPSYPG